MIFRRSAKRANKASMTIFIRLQPSLSNVSTTRIMHNTGGLGSKESNAAAWEGGKGAAAGAAKVQ